jgi:hypothetical protein
VFGAERLAGALLDRLTSHVHILDERRQLPPLPLQAPITPAANRHDACPRYPGLTRRSKKAPDIEGVLAHRDDGFRLADAFLLRR